MIIVLQENGNKIKSSKLVIYKHDENSVDYVAEVISAALGYDATQAYSCALITQTAGQYIIKKYKSSERGQAEEILELITSQNVPAKLL